MLSREEYAMVSFRMKTVCEAREGLLLTISMEETNIQIFPEGLFRLTQSCTSEHINIPINLTSIQALQMEPNSLTNEKKILHLL